MRTFAVVLLLTVLCASSMAQCGPLDLSHRITYKTFYTALYECGQYYNMCNSTVDDYIRSGYPNSPDTNRLLHCAMVNLGMWSDSTEGKENVISYYFQPNPNEADYVEKTRQCISNTLSCVDRCDQNTRAYLTFSCYRSHYGCLVDTAQFVPFTENDFVEFVVKFNSLVWGISRETYEKYINGEPIDESLFKNALWSAGIRTGLNDCEKGPNMDIAYMQYGLPELISAQTRCCVANVFQQYNSKVDKRDQYLKVYESCLDSLLTPAFNAAIKTFVTSLDATA